MSQANNEIITFDTRHLKVKINGTEVSTGDVEFGIHSVINNHTRINIGYYTQVNEGDFYQELFGEEEIKMTVESILPTGETKMLFKGYIEEIEIEVSRGNKYIHISGVSNSIILDKEKRYVSYQDTSLTYQQVFNYIKGLYDSNEIGIVWEGMSEATGKFLVQYDETDWEFINRILRDIDICMQVKGTGVRLGFNSQRSINQLDMRRAKINGRKNFNNSYAEQTIVTDELFLIGEGIKINIAGTEEEYVIISASYTLDNRVMIGNYTVIKEALYTREKIGNHNIAGKAIEGKIVEVLDVDGIAKMTVNFNTSLVRTGEMIEDENGNSSEATTEEQLGSELFKFPYVTPYSQSHTGYFCTPEVNDNVVVYFPTEKESDGFVIGTVNSAGNGRFTDRFNRNFIIPAEGSENGEGIDDPQYNMTLANNVFGVTTGTTNTEVEYENLIVSEDSVTTVSNDKSVTVENDMNYTITNNKNVQVDNNLNYTVSNDYQADVNNYKISANANVEAQGTSAVNIKGMEVKVEADTQANLKGGAMVQVGAPQVSIGS